ncbi:pseudouridine synthase [Aeromicrobium sp. PE09-221]|uniref:pseudouridine synthase n=1 Tax=Aeromicrobium sp. PE09-221 TaxID=1898043 RepID=UPI00191C71C2|nr:pseudouridine synthase [Aeromicrobium sp. PE09-221]
MGDWLRSRLPDHVDAVGMLRDQRFVYDSGRPVVGGDPYLPHTFVWFHRDLREETPVPGALPILYHDQRIVVVDKPPFLATIPRGRHIRQSVVVRLRASLGLPELTPAHRLDRITSGVLVLVTERRWRGAYQSLFQQRRVEKVYRALAPVDDTLTLPRTVRNHIHKVRGEWRAKVVGGAPVNAETDIELEARHGGHGVYRLVPRTGRTHQLRLHLAGLGVPIVDDPLYPEITRTDPDDFTRPLQLLASELRFADPVDGVPRCFASARRLPLPPEQ